MSVHLHDVERAYTTLDHGGPVRPAYTTLQYRAEDGISVERLRKILNLIYLMDPGGVPQHITGISLNDHHLTVTLADPTSRS